MALFLTARQLPGFSVARWPIFRHPLPAYGGALGLLAIAFLVRWNLDFFFGNSAKLIFFVITAALSAFLFGRGPGILCTVLGALLGDYFFVIPRQGFHFHDRATTVAVISSVLEGLIISVCAGYLHRALEIRAAAEQEARALYESARRAHETAEELNRTKDYFLAVLSHELRGPLSAIH
jgi:K+-sensing histidine kinase KdpD